MNIKKIRFFAGLTGTQAKWLNSMASKGYRLVKTGKLEYEFEECEPGKYVYTVEYVGDRSRKDEDGYKGFLESLGYRVFYKNINLDYSIFKVTIRPWADKGGWVSSTAPGSTYNKELLIVEKENDGKPFELHTENEDRIEMYRRMSMPWYYAAFFSIVAAVLVWPYVIPVVFLGAVALLCIAGIIAAERRIHKIKKNREIEE